MYLSTAFGSLNHESFIDKLKCYGLKRNTIDFLGVISQIVTSSIKMQCLWNMQEN